MLPWVGHRSPQWESEPLRFVGIRAVYALCRAADAHEERTGRPSPLVALAGRIAGRSAFRVPTLYRRRARRAFG